MFTVRFLSIFDPESPHKSTQTCIECPHYEVQEHEYGYTVTTYSDMTVKNGVDRHVTKDVNRVGRFDVCYIMNSAGKTIDTLRCNGEVAEIN